MEKYFNKFQFYVWVLSLFFHFHFLVCFCRLISFFFIQFLFCIPLHYSLLQFILDCFHILRGSKHIHITHSITGVYMMNTKKNGYSFYDFIFYYVHSHCSKVKSNKKIEKILHYTTPFHILLS